MSGTDVSYYTLKFIRGGTGHRYYETWTLLRCKFPFDGVVGSVEPRSVVIQITGGHFWPKRHDSLQD